MLRGGTITDDHGTYPLLSALDGNQCLINGKNPQWCSGILHSPPLPTADINVFPCTLTDQPVPYVLGAGCGIVPPYIFFDMLIPSIASCPSSPCMPGYFAGVPPSMQFFTFWRSSLAATTVSCAGGVLTASATWDDVHPGGCPDLASPTHSVSIAIPIETPRPQVCCVPCPIPKKNLTVTWNGPSPGSSVLIWNGASWRGACANGMLWTLECSGNATHARVVKYANPDCTGAVTDGGWLEQRIDFTCIPFHLHYRVDSSWNPLSCKILNGGMDCGSTSIDVYIDE